MSYVIRTRTSGEIPLSYRTDSGIQYTGSFPKRLATTYSWRTGPNKDTDVSGLADLNASPHDGAVGRLAAEVSAIREINNELRSSSVLKEGTWGVKDAGHVFSTVKVKMAPVRDVTYKEVGGQFTRLSSEVNGAAYSQWVDPFSHRIFSQLGTFHVPGVGAYRPSFSPVARFSTVVTDSAQVLLSASPDLAQAGLGETLAELASVPGLLKSVLDMRLVAGDLIKKWGYLSSEVQAGVNRCFTLGGVSKGTSKEVASAYLQWSFALKPLIEDTRNLLKVAGGLQATLTASTSRRRVIAPETVSLNTSPVGEDNLHLPFSWKNGTSPSANPGTSGGMPGQGLTADKVSGFGVQSFGSYDTHLSMRYRLFKPVSSWQEQAYILNQKLGIIYPSLLWDLSPWSFLIDWFTHMGNCIDNVWALTKGVYTPDYCYATCKSKASVFFGSNTRIFKSGSWYKNWLDFGGNMFTESTGRVPIMGYYGLKPAFSTLNSTQRKLLGAVGLTHLK